MLQEHTPTKTVTNSESIILAATITFVVK